MFDQTNIEELKNVIGKTNTIGVIIAENPSLDTMAAGLSLYLSLCQAAKKVSICCKTEPLVEISSLVGIDKVQKELSVGGDLTISLPYQQGTIEKISYNIEGDRINLVVKAAGGELAFDPSQVRFLRDGGGADLIFCLGMRHLAELAEVGRVDGTQTTVVNIDHHPTNENFGTLALVDSSASSISELVAHLILSLSLPMDLDISQNLLSGINFATDNFQDPRTSPLAFETMAQLLRNGAKRSSNMAQRVNFPSQDLFAQDLKSVLPNNFTDEDQRRTPIPKRDIKAQKRPPADWLAPKIYKGSTTV